jgi:AcrR family transcriptional regulator
MTESSMKWIKAGYELLAKEGPDGIKVEKLARQLGLNKSGFYHYFGDREMYFHQLNEFHLQLIKKFHNEISNLRHFDPDYLKLLLKYKTSLLVQSQLRRHENITVFKDTFNKVVNSTERKSLRLWAAYLKLSENDPAALKLWKIIRDLFFLRLDPDKLNLNYLRSLTEEIKVIVAEIKHKST